MKAEGGAVAMKFKVDIDCTPDEARAFSACRT
jgi:hypothetical protein